MAIRNDDSLQDRKPTEPQKDKDSGNPEGAGITGGTQEKKRPTSQDVQDRADTGTGL